MATTAAVAAVVAVVSLAGAPAADAGPGHVVATYRLPPGYYTLQVGLSAVWAAKADESHYTQLYRINPTSHRMTRVAALPFPGGSMTIAFGSIWVSDYFGNGVWRVSPTGHVQARIRTGLQPEQMHAAFGSLWVSNHHGASLTRINPVSDTVRATVQVGEPGTFRSGPQDVTDDGVNVYVGSSNLQALQSVDPSTDHVSTPASTNDAFCGPLAAIGGFIWSVDHCSGTTYQFSTDGAVQHTFSSTGSPASMTTRRDQLWIGDDTVTDPNTGVGSHAVLERRNPQSGALIRSVPIGGDASSLVAGFGDFWVYDATANTIRRIEV